MNEIDKGRGRDPKEKEDTQRCGNSPPQFVRYTTLYNNYLPFTLM